MNEGLFRKRLRTFAGVRAAVASVGAGVTSIAVAGALFLVACNSSSDVGPAAGTRRDMVIPACSWPAAATTFDAGAGTGCVPRSMFQICQVPEGSVLHPDGTITTPAGETVTCQDACAPAEYSLECTGSGPPPISIPAPDPSLGCNALGIPTNPAVLFHCCPCR